MPSSDLDYSHIFANQLNVYGDNVAIIEASGNCISYLKLDELIDALHLSISKKFKRHVKNAHEMKKLFIILMDNSLESVVNYLYCLKYNHAALLLSDDIHNDYLAGIIELYQPSGILSARDNESSIRVLSLDDHEDIHPDLAVLLSTSGSTGSPKQVRLSRQNIQENAASICAYLSITEDQRAISSLPAHYSYGLSVINSHLLAGASIVVTNASIVTRGFWELFNKHSVTSFSGVPYTYEVLEKLRFIRMDLPSLQYMTQAGGRLPKKLVTLFSEALHEKGKRLYLMYGQTEATARIAYLPPEKIKQHPDSIGLAIPKGDLYLKNEEGHLIEQCEVVGELIYRGPNVMMGYARSRADLVKPSELSELATGDRAYRNEQGLFFIVGRSNRTVKVFGLRVDLDDLENKLSENGLKAYALELEGAILLVTDLNEIKQDIVEYLSNVVALNKSCFKVVVLDSIPRTLNSKVNYSTLKERLIDIAAQGAK